MAIHETPPVPPSVKTLQTMRLVAFEVSEPSEAGNRALVKTMVEWLQNDGFGGLDCDVRTLTVPNGTTHLILVKR